MDILIIEHILLNIVDHMHYQDVINLGMACKAVRSVVYPPMDLEYRIPKLIDRSCGPWPKRNCLYCNKKICDVSHRPFRSIQNYSKERHILIQAQLCKVCQLWPGLPGLRHVSKCIPYCEGCYFRSFSR